MNITVIKRVAYYTALLLLTGIILLSFFLHGINNYPRAKFYDMIHGNAYRPFVCRVLFPTIVRTVSAAIPRSVHQYSENYVVETPFFGNKFKWFGWEPEHSVEYFVAGLLMYLCFFSFSLMCKKLAEETTSCSSAMLKIIPFIALICLPSFFRYAMYIYDPLQLFLFTTMLYLMLTERFRIYLLCFPLAVFNKETSLLLIFQFFLYFRSRLRIKKFMTYLAIQTIVYTSIKLALTIIFSKNPGSFVEFHLFDHNIQTLMKGHTFSQIFAFLGIIFLITFDFPRKNEFLRLSSIAFAIPLFGLILFFGFMDEYRAFYELYPVVLCLVCDTLAQFYQIPQMIRNRTQQSELIGEK